MKKTKVYEIFSDNIDLDIINECSKAIENGELVVIPTETVYGLGANALNKDAVDNIFKAKGRPQDNPLIIHVSNKDIHKYVKRVPKVASELMDLYWPGPLTLIFEKEDIVPYNTSGGLETIGVRMPNNKVALDIIQNSGVPIAAPSANLSGKPSPTDIDSCIEDLMGRVDYIVGGDECEFGLESTVVDCTSDPICILRPGAITIDMLKKVDENAYIDPAILHKETNDFKPKAPGMKYRHYAPNAPLQIIEGELDKTIEKINEIVQNRKDGKIGVICTDETKGKYKADIVISLGNSNDIQQIGSNLFKTLRKMDSLNVDYILCESFSEEGIGLALMNRLKKAAAYNILKV